MILSAGTNPTIAVQIVDDTGLPVLGLVAATFPTVTYSVAGPNADVAFPALSDLAAITTAYTAGGVKERGNGYYRLDAPTGVAATVGTVATIRGEATGKHLICPPIEIGPQTNANLTQILGTALTETNAGQLTAGFKKLLDVLTPVFTLASLNQTGDVYAQTNSVSFGLNALLTAIQNVQNGTFVSATIPALLERPDAGSTTIQIVVTFADETGAAKNLDAGNPAIALLNDAGTDLSSRLGTWANPSTGKYTINYTDTSTDAIEGLHWDLTGTVNAKLRRYVGYTQIVDTTAVSFTASDRTNQGTILTQVNKLLFDGSSFVKSTPQTAVTLPVAPTDWLTAAAVKADAVTKIQMGLAVPGSQMDLVNAPNATALAAIAAAVWNALTSGITLTNSIGKRILDFVTSLVYVAPATPTDVEEAETEILAAVAAGSTVGGFTDAALLAMKNNLTGAVVTVRGPMFGSGGALEMRLTVGDDYALADARQADISLDGTVLPDLTGATVQLRLAAGARILVNGSVVVATGSVRSVRFELTAAQTRLLSPSVNGLFAVLITTPAGREITPDDGRGTLTVLPKVAP